MSTFIQLGESDTLYDLLSLLQAKLGSNLNSAALEKLLNGEPKIAEFLQQGVIANLTQLISSTTAEEFVVLISLVEAQLPRIERQHVVHIITKLYPLLIEKSIKSNLTNQYKLELLVELFNIYNEDPALFGTATESKQQAESVTLLSSLLLSTLKFSAENQLQAQLTPLYPSVLLLLNDWQQKKLISPANVTEILALINQLTSNSSPEYVYKYLKSLDSLNAKTDSKLIEAAQSAASHAAKAAIQAPINENNAAESTQNYLTPARLLPLQSVLALQNSSNADAKRLYELLFIFGTDQVESYIKFSLQNADWLKNNKFDHEENLKKLRILSLAALAQRSAINSNNNTTAVSYADVVHALQLENISQVEDSVIDAVVSGRIEARIDQSNQNVLIKRAQSSILVPKQAGGQQTVTADWEGLNKKLTAWKGNLQQVLNIFNQHSNLMPMPPGSSEDL
jgi:hypothetical protein